MSSPRAPWNHGPSVVEAHRFADGRASAAPARSGVSMGVAGDGPSSMSRSEATTSCVSRRSLFQPGQVGGDERVPGVDVGRLQDGADLFQRHVEIAEPSDDLCRGDLLRRVTAVARVRVDLRRDQQPEPVVVPEGLHAEVGGPGEITDGQ